MAQHAGGVTRPRHHQVPAHRVETRGDGPDVQVVHREMVNTISSNLAALAGISAVGCVIERDRSSDCWLCFRRSDPLFRFLAASVPSAAPRDEVVGSKPIGGSTPSLPAPPGGDGSARRLRGRPRRRPQWRPWRAGTCRSISPLTRGERAWTSCMSRPSSPCSSPESRSASCWPGAAGERGGCGGRRWGDLPDPPRPARRQQQASAEGRGSSLTGALQHPGSSSVLGAANVGESASTV